MILPNLSIIACMDENGRIGDRKNNSLLDHIPSDMKWFKKKTLNNVIVMGRITYDSIGKLLPNRYNIILTKNIYNNSDLSTKSSEIFSSIQTVLKYAHDNPHKEVFIIGGSTIYEQFIEYCNKMYITHCCHNFNIPSKDSIYFPHYDEFNWQIKSSYGLYDKYYLKFNTYIRK